MARLLEARRHRCVVIQGPAGCGKTSALLAWRRELMPLNFDVAWLSLAPEDNEVARFTECLLASLSEVDPDLVRGATPLLDHDNDAMSLEHWAITLVQNIGQHPREIVLMLDDAHHLQAPRTLQLLHWMLDYAPARLHVVLASRFVVPIPQVLSRLRSQDLLKEFDLQDLRFSAAESERFLCEELSGLTKHDAQVLHALTDGWVAGLQLFALDLKNRRATTYSPVEVRDALGFASYFEREILVRLPEEDLHLLTSASICNRFCASLCATLMGQRQATPRIMNQLYRIEMGNLFITQVNSHDRETWYRLHPLLREVLKVRLDNQAADHQASLHALARDWFNEQGHVDEAVRHAVQAADAPTAAGIIEGCAYDLLSNGDLGHLAGLLRELPVQEVETRFGLLVISAHLQLYSLDFAGLTTSLACLRANQHLLDTDQRYSLTLLHAGSALYRDDTEALLALTPQLQAIGGDCNDFVRDSRRNLLAWSYMSQGEYELARQLLDREGHPRGARRRSLFGRCISGMTLTLEGRISQAEHIFREVLQETGQQGRGFIMVTCMASGLLAVVLYELNDNRGICQLLEPLLKILERVSIPDTVLHGLLTLNAAYWHAGRHDEAAALLDRLESYAMRFNLQRILTTALLVRMRQMLARGRTPQAEVLLLRIEELAGKRHGDNTGQVPQVHVLHQLARVDLLLHKKDFSEAAEQISSLIALCSAQRRWRRVACLRLQLAVAEQGRGHEELARMHIIEALRQGHRAGLLRSLLDASPNALALLQSVLGDDRLDPVLAFYLERLLAAGTTAGQAVAALNPIARLSDRETEILELLAPGLTNKKIARMLGISPETVKWHLKNIFTKLGVEDRDDAIARMRDQSAAQPIKQS